MKVRSIVAGALAGIALLAGAAGQRATAQEAARIGDAAPVFSLTDTAGAAHGLAQYAGKVVVLEWFNADCPGVKKVHKQSRAMAETAARFRAQGVVWLAVCSSAPGKQGAGVERNTRAITEYGIEYPILLDPAGTVGRAYGARSTPTMVVIDAQGRVAYRGGFDDGKNPGTNVVGPALEAILGGRAPAAAETQAFG